MAPIVDRWSINPHSWVEMESEGPGPWASQVIDRTEYEFPFVDFWPSSKTMLSLGKLDRRTGNIQNNFLFSNQTDTTGTIDGPIDYNGRFTIVRHDSEGNLEMDVRVGDNSQHTNAFNVTLTIIPRPGPYLYPQLHLGGRNGTSMHAWRFNHLPEVNLQKGTMMTHNSGWPFWDPVGSMEVDTLLDLERTIGSNGVVKYGATWEVEEENEDGEMVLIPYGISWTPSKEDN